MGVEKPSDDLWIGVKGQSNFVIAGSLRNIFRYSLERLAYRGRALTGLGLLTAVPNPIKLRILYAETRESGGG